MLPGATAKVTPTAGDLTVPPRQATNEVNLGTLWNKMQGGLVSHLDVATSPVLRATQTPHGNGGAENLNWLQPPRRPHFSYTCRPVDKVGFKN